MKKGPEEEQTEPISTKGIRWQDLFSFGGRFVNAQEILDDLSKQEIAQDLMTTRRIEDTEGRKPEARISKVTRPPDPYTKNS